MTAVETSLDIAAPRSRVAVFFVPQRMPYWFGPEMQAEFEVLSGESDFRVGQKIRITGKLLRKEVRLTVVITRYELGRVLEWRFRDEHGIRGLQRWELDAVEHGNNEHTQVTETNQYELPSAGRFARLADKFWMRPNIARRARIHLRKLRQLAERV